jgi:hypothetical protein
MAPPNCITWLMLIPFKKMADAFTSAIVVSLNKCSESGGQQSLEVSHSIPDHADEFAAWIKIKREMA